MPIPWLVETVQDDTGNIVYNADPGVLNSAINSQTAANLKALMRDAARYGTSRKAFRRLRRKRLFKNLSWGPKPAPSMIKWTDLNMTGWQHMPWPRMELEEYALVF
jgi:hypothetical protein